MIYLALTCKREALWVTGQRDEEQPPAGWNVHGEPPSPSYTKRSQNIIMIPVQNIALEIQWLKKKKKATIH